MQKTGQRLGLQNVCLGSPRLFFRNMFKSFTSIHHWGAKNIPISIGLTLRLLRGHCSTGGPRSSCCATKYKEIYGDF